MGFLYLLEGIRNPVLDAVMSLITRLGEETAFLVAALILLWCADKRRGYYVLFVGFIGVLANQFLKLLFRVPRPWVLDPEFTIVESAREAATGYSFPSGHTQSAVGTFGAIAYTSKKKWCRYLAVAAAVLVPFSRMYLGVHTPADVLVSAAIAVALIFLLKPLVYAEKPMNIPSLLTTMFLLAVAYLCFTQFYPFPEDTDVHNLQSGAESAYTMLGCLLGFVVVYFVDEKWLHFPVKAVWWAQVIKVILGLALVLAVKSGLKAPLNLLMGEAVGRMMRYFLVAVAAGVVWPFTFPFFAKFGKKV